MSSALICSVSLAGLGAAGGMAASEFMGLSWPVRWVSAATLAVVCAVGGPWVMIAAASLLVPALTRWARRETSRYAGISVAAARAQNFHHMHLTALSFVAVAIGSVVSVVYPAVDYRQLAPAVLVGCVAGVYCLAGLAKLRQHYWADSRLIPLYESLLGWVRVGDGVGRFPTPPVNHRWLTGRPVLITAVGIEVAAPLMALGAWLQVVMLAALITFHLVVRGLLMISFRENLTILCGLLAAAVMGT